MSEAPLAARLELLEAVLFDLDGTLVETDNKWAAQLADKLRPMARLFRFDADIAGRWLVMAIEGPSNYAVSILEHLGMSKLILGLADRIRRSKGVATRGASQPVEGTIEMLETLAPHYKLAVVTTRARPEAMSFIKQLDLEHFFPVVITRSDVFRMKPSPDPVREAGRRLGVPIAKCAMVGDTTMDVRASVRAGAVAVAVLSGFGERDELERAGADIVLNRAEELLERL